MLFLALIALRLLVISSKVPCTCSAQQDVDRQTDKHTDIASTVTVAAHTHRVLKTCLLHLPEYDMNPTVSAP